MFTEQTRVGKWAAPLHSSKAQWWIHAELMGNFWTNTTKYGLLWFCLINTSKYSKHKYGLLQLCVICSFAQILHRLSYTGDRCFQAYFFTCFFPFSARKTRACLRSFPDFNMLFLMHDPFCGCAYIRTRTCTRSATHQMSTRAHGQSLRSSSVSGLAACWS